MPAYAPAIEEQLKPLFEFMADPKKIEFEDDIVLTTPPSVASGRIRQAMAQVPPDTDRYRLLVYIACCELFAKA